MTQTLRVFVYYNLTKKVFSIKAGGRVVAHAPRLVLRDAEFRVGERGRARVLRTGVRNVHAGVSGDLVFDPEDIKGLTPATRRVRYNPFRSPHFTDDADAPVERAGVVHFRDGKCFVA